MNHNDRPQNHQPLFRKRGEFTAQGHVISALFAFYVHIEQFPDSPMEMTPVVVFMAFAVEAYINSIGYRKIAFWDEFERSPTRMKVVFMHRFAGKEADWGSGHLHFMTELFQIRDKMAHGKPEVFSSDPMTREQTKENNFTMRDKPEWVERITKEWVINAKPKFRNLMIYLASLFDLPESDHLIVSQAGIITV